MAGSFAVGKFVAALVLVVGVLIALSAAVAFQTPVVLGYGAMCAAAGEAGWLLRQVPARVGPYRMNLRHGRRKNVTAEAELQATQRTVRAIRALGAARSETSLGREAVRQVMDLLPAHVVELLLCDAADGDSAVLYRAGPGETLWHGSVGSALAVPGPAASVVRVGSDSALVGEFRVHSVTADARLTEQATATLRTVAAVVESTLAAVRLRAELREAALRAEHEATHDPTTGLPTRRYLLKLLDLELARRTAAGDSDPVAIAALNITGYGQILDGCDWDVDSADTLLRHAGVQLAGIAGPGERIGHLGGDTFIAVLAEVSGLGNAQSRARALLAALATPVQLDAGPVELAGAAGLAYAVPAETSGSALLRQAQVALRQARARGMTVEVYRADDDVQGPAALVLAAELQAAMPADELDLGYQLVLDLASGRPVAVEAVPVWRHPSRGLLAAESWLPLLEQSSLAGPYTGWLVETALRARATWPSPIPVAVNLPSRSFLDPSLPASLARVLATTGTAADQLILNLPESRALGAIDVVDRVVDSLAISGVGIAVDGFGSGSLARLRRVQATEIRLSDDLARHVVADVESAAIVRAVVGLADELGLRVTACGLESHDQLAALMRLGVGAGQGSVFGGPVHHDQIGSVVATTARTARAAASASVIPLRARRKI